MEIALVISATINVLLLVVLLVFTNRQAKGTFNVIETPRGKTFSLELDKDPSDLEGKDSIVFRIKNEKE